MTSDYIYIIFFFVLGILFVSGAFILSWFMRPKLPPDAVKNAPYECGEIIKGTSRIQFNVRYYLIALIFVVFDVEILFMMPWAVVFREMGLAAYFEMMLFMAVLVFGLIYAWKKGAFEWQ